MARMIVDPQIDHHVLEIVDPNVDRNVQEITEG